MPPWVLLLSIAAVFIVVAFVFWSYFIGEDQGQDIDTGYSFGHIWNCMQIINKATRAAVPRLHPLNWVFLWVHVFVNVIVGFKYF